MTARLVAPSPPRPAAVVGAAGFIGGALSGALERSGTPTAAYTRHRPAVLDGRLAPAVAAAGTVFLVAGRTSPALAELDAEAGAIELAELHQLLELLSASPPPGGPRRRIVLASSGGTVYDPATSPPYSETAPVGPVTAYGRLKLATEELVRGFAGALDPVVARLSNVYGPGQRLGTGQGVVGHWLVAAKDGRPLLLYGDPGTTRDYLYIDDAVEALLALGAAPDPLPSVLNVGSGTPTSLQALAQLVRGTVGEHLEVTVVPARGFDRQDTWLDVRCAATTLGWAPRTDLADGVRATWAALAPG